MIRKKANITTRDGQLVSDLIGAPVCDREGNRLGQVHDILLDGSGRATHFAVEFLGPSAAPLPVPFAQVRLGAAVTLDISAETIERYLQAATRR